MQQWLVTVADGRVLLRQQVRIEGQVQVIHSETRQQERDEALKQRQEKQINPQPVDQLPLPTNLTGPAEQRHHCKKHTK